MDIYTLTTGKIKIQMLRWVLLRPHEKNRKAFPSRVKQETGIVDSMTSDRVWNWGRGEIPPIPCSHPGLLLRGPARYNPVVTALAFNGQAAMMTDNVKAHQTLISSVAFTSKFKSLYRNQVVSTSYFIRNTDCQFFKESLETNEEKVSLKETFSWGVSGIIKQIIRGC